MTLQPSGPHVRGQFKHRVKKKKTQKTKIKQQQKQTIFI